MRIRHKLRHTRGIDIAARDAAVSLWCKMPFQHATRSLAVSVLQCNQRAWTGIRWRTRLYAPIRIRPKLGHTWGIDIAEMLQCALWCKMPFQHATRSLALSVLQCNQSAWTGIRWRTRLFAHIRIRPELGHTWGIDIAEMLQCAL